VAGARSAADARAAPILSRKEIDLHPHLDPLQIARRADHLRRAASAGLSQDGRHERRASRQGSDGSFRFRWTARSAVPIALACGRLEFRPISERCGVWADRRSSLGRDEEFADTEKMSRRGDRWFGPYDGALRPHRPAPSFPSRHGESVSDLRDAHDLAGDRSLVSLRRPRARALLGQETSSPTRPGAILAQRRHSRVLRRPDHGEIYGAERARMERRSARLPRARNEGLDRAIRSSTSICEEGTPTTDSRAFPTFKGALFLQRIEEVFGRGRFDRFLRSYFDTHAFRKHHDGTSS